MSAVSAHPAPPLYLVDASIYVFRAWHSLPDQFQDAQGWPTNAVHGFARFLLDLLERERPRHIAIAFDEALDSGFRHRLYPAYKANREPAPESLKYQFRQCMALCEALGADILKLCVEVGGCLTGEHGVGVEKRDLMPVQFTPDDMEAQMRVKDVFDPQWLLNPAKVFPLDVTSARRGA